MYLCVHPAEGATTPLVDHRSRPPVSEVCPGPFVENALLPSLGVSNVSGQWSDDGVTQSSVAAWRRSARPPVSHVDRVSARGSNSSAVCPPVSLDGVSCESGEVAPMQHSHDRLFPSLTRVLMLTHKCASKKGRSLLLRKDRRTQVQVSLLVHPLTDNVLPTVQERSHHLLFLSFLLLPPVWPPRAMIILEICTMVIDQLARLFPTPVLPLHVTINLEIRTLGINQIVRLSSIMVLWLPTGSPRRGPNSTAYACSLVSSSSRRGDRSRPPVSVVSASSFAANREPNVQSGTSVPTWRVTSSSARGTATNSPGQSQRVSRQTALSVPRERHSTPPPRNSRQSAIRALAGDVRDTAGAIVRLLAPHRPRRSSRPPNRVPRGLVNRSSTIDRLAWTCCQCVVCAFLQHLALCFSSPFLLCFFRAFCFAALATIAVRPTHVEEPFFASTH